MRAARGPGRKARDAAALLPVAGVALLASPLAGLFAQGGDLLGLPRVYVYVFGVWLALILLARVLARRLSGAPDEEE